MLKCKRCDSARYIKKGIVAGKQRYRCKDCNLFSAKGTIAPTTKSLGRRHSVFCSTRWQKALFVCSDALLEVITHLYTAGFGTSAKRCLNRLLRGILPKWNSMRCGTSLVKKENFGCSKRLTVAHGELWTGCSAIVILQLSDACITR